MSAPRSETERPGDDFVIWPESPEREPRPLHEAIRPESWEALAPPERVEPSAPAGSGEPVAVSPGTADVPQRFYPASRQWFRTTTPVASVEAGEKWWQMEPTVPVVREAGRSPGVPPPVEDARAASGFAEALAPSDVLSPEAIWEMAAAELEQASRLGAHPVTTAGAAEAGAAASAPALKTPEAAGIASAEAEALSPAAAAIAAAAAAAASSFAPGVPDVSGAADASDLISEGPGAAAVASGAGVTGSGGGALAAAAAAAEGSSGPSLADEQAGRAPEPDLEKPVVAVDPRGRAVSEKAPAAEVAPVAPAGAPPVPVVPAPVASDEWLRIPPARLPGQGPKDPERAAPWPAAPMMVAPGSAVPAPDDDPLADFLAVEAPPPAVRVEEEVSPVRGAVRPVGAGMARMPVELAKKGHAFRTIPEAPAAPPGTGGEENVSGEEPVRRRRRERRSASPEPGSPRGRWFRRCAVTAAVVLVAVALTAVLTRDQWPPEWRREVRLWRRQAEQLFWPEAHQSPQRGVLPRASDPSSAWPGSSVLDPAAQNPPPVAVPSPDDAASATGTAETSGSGLPDVPRSVDPSLTPAETPEAASAPAAAAPQGSGAEVAPDGIPVRRAEPVPEDDAEAEVEGGGAAAAVPAGPVSDPAADPAADGGALNLWSGDDSSAAAAGPPPFEPTAGEAAPPSSTDQAVAEGMEVVRRLVGARSADEVLPWIDGAGAQEAAVRSYYAKYPPRPMTDAVIEHAHSGTIPATGAHAHIFNVLSTTHPLGFPVSAEATPDGYRIDWPSFIQWRDRWLQRFAESPSDEPQELYVVLRRTHYFNDDVPDLENKLAFRVSSAIPEDEGVVAFVDKNSDLGQSLSEMYGWRVLYFPVVELQWVRTSPEARHVRLNRVVRPTWRRAGE